MSFKVKMFAACGLFVWIVIIVLGMSVYALNATGDLAGKGEPPQTIADYASRTTILLLMIGVLGLVVTQITVFITVTAIHRRLARVLDNVNESAYELEGAVRDDPEHLPEAVSFQAQLLIQVTRDLVELLEGRSAIRRWEAGPTDQDRGKLSARDVIPLGDDDF